MLTIVLKYFFIFFFTTYIYHKFITSSRTNTQNNFAISLMLSLIAYFLSTYYEGVNYIIPLLLFWIITSIYHFMPQLSFTAIIISFTISFSLHAFASFIIIFLAVPFLHNTEQNPLIALATGIVQIILTRWFFKIKRFSKGIPLKFSTSSLNIATLFCLLLLTFVFYISFYYTILSNQAITVFAFFIALAFLIFWWQAQITKSYKQRLLMSELESRRTSDVEKDAEIERLSTILHRNNNLLNALYDATINGLRTDFETEEELTATREKLIANIEKVAGECENISSDYRRKKARDFDTKLPLLDDLLHRLDGDAIEQKITFQVYLGVSLKDYVPDVISESDLSYTVNDLLRNAFKSTLTCEKRIVQLQFYKLGKHLVMEVSDNGIPFEVRSLVNMGLEKLTTYEDGSGIGLVDIWNSKNKYGATYHLDEFVTPSPFSKKISLTFDKKNRYSIRTFRKDEILQKSRRADLQVYDDK